MNRTHPFKRLGILLIAGTLFATTLVYSQTNVARTGRFYRGTGTNTSYQSFVYPLDFQKGVAFDDVGGNATNWFPYASTNYVFGSMRYHYNSTNPASATNVALRIPCNNPIVAFGSRVGGSPLYFNQDYHFGVYAGVTEPYSTTAIVIGTYRTSDNAYVGGSYFEIPAMTNTNLWKSFLTNGYEAFFTTNGLTTTLRFDDPYTNLWGIAYSAGGYHIIHNATPTATNYYYTVAIRGYIATPGGVGMWMNTDTNLLGAWSRMYTLEFKQRPAWRALFLDQPQFTGTPAPSFYQGKSAAELLTNAPVVTNSISLAPSACTNLDASPELRRHPVLDQFVSDMRRDPLALVNYVQNEIELTDALAYNDNGAVSDVSINLGGVNRSALGTFMEKQGSPTEQCALLVYLLRQAGVPATYVFPAENGLKMADSQLSKLLRMQIHGAINFKAGANNQPYTTNSLIPVNYPWVAAYIGTNWVHLYPWLKDTEVVEGLNLYDFMPANYKTSYQWIKDYLYGKTNIMGLSSDDDTPQTLFPLFVKSILAINSPGISLDDIGVRAVNRRHLYARWSDFPRPTMVTNSSIAVESLGSFSITNVNPLLTNIFDTVSVTVSSDVNPNTKLTSGTLRMVDLHNRKFLIRHEKISGTSHRMIMSLEPYRSGTTGTGAFTDDTALLKQQSLTNTLSSSDDSLTVQFVFKRHRSLPTAFTPPDKNSTYLGFSEWTSITNNRPMRKGDLEAVCLNCGRVTPAMLQVHAQELWNMESTLKADPSATNSISPDIYQGTLAYLMGMAYFEKVDRFDTLNQHLHKVQVASQLSFGLAGIRAARDASGALPSGNIDLVQPSVDMFFAEVAIAGNTTIHQDSGDNGMVPNDDYYHLNIANGSAQEHSIINHYFHQTDAMSTVKLLQLAQAKSATNGQSGFLILDYLNYQTEGNKNYPTTGTVKLKDQSPSLWAKITNTFAGYLSTNENFVQTFITPGPITNQSGSFKGMAALIFEPAGAVAAILEKNGGYGAKNPAGSDSLGNTPNISVSVDSDNNYSVNLTPPSAGNVNLAPDSYAAYNSGNVANNASQNFYNLTDFQTTWTAALLNYAGIGQAGSQNLNFAQGVQAANGNSGYMGWLSDGLSPTGRWVADPVHTVTGEFYVNATDLTLPGPMPLSIKRNYSSLNLAENEFGYGWKLNYMPYLSLNTNGTVLFAAEPDGAVLAYEQTATNANVYLPSVGKNPQLNNASSSGFGSVANRLNNRVQKQVVSTNTFYYLSNPDGSKRTFQVLTFSSGTVSRTRPYLTRWEDSSGNFFTFEYGVDSTQPDFAEVRRIQSSNGNYLGFYYDVFGHIVQAYTGDGRRLFYEYDQFGDLVTVTFPDQSFLGYDYQHRTQSVTNGGTVTATSYSTHLIVQENKPDGRTLKNEYDSFRRITNQWSTAGVDLTVVRSASFIYTNNFNPTNSYTNTITGFTLIKDAFNNQSRYDYTNGLITKITDPLNQTVIQDWYEAAETNKPGYYPRSLESRTDQRGLVTQFKYDFNGNLTNTVFSGDLTGDGTTQSATNTVTYNANNLPTSSVDPVGNRMDTLYDSQFPFLPALVVRYAVSTPVNSNLMTYESITNTFVTGGVSYTNAAFGLVQRQIRAVGSPDAATNEFAHDGRGFIIQSIAYTGIGDPAVTNSFLYNDRGELAEKTDAAGVKSTSGFDALGRLITLEVFDAGQSQPMFWNYSYYNDNGELVWSDGPRYNPEDYVWRDYDGAGRLFTEIHWRSESKADGSGVQAPAETNLYAQTFYQYDVFGNLLRSVNPRGSIITNNWDKLGRLVQRKALDLDGTTALSSEGFAYEPGGQVRYHTNALGGVTTTLYTTTGRPCFRATPDGATNGWRYYLDGRIKREIQGNGAYWQTTYDDANRTTTRIFYSAAGTALATTSTQVDRRGNVIRRVDAGNNVFTTTFDGLDRAKVTAGPAIVTVSSIQDLMGNITGYVTNVLQQVSTNFYAAAGRSLTNVNALGETAVTAMDALGRTTSTKIFSATGGLIREKYFDYSADHNRTTVTDGSGAGAINHTTWTDNDGHSVLSVANPAASVLDFTRQSFDLAGNLSHSEHSSSYYGSVTVWSQADYSYDGLNRLTKKVDRDNAATTYAYNPLNNLTNRTMPGPGGAGGLQWQASFNNAGLMMSERNIGADGGTTRTNTYAYFTGGSPFAGQLQTKTDGRGVSCTFSYDDWLRPTNLAYSGSLAEHNLNTIYQFEPRGLVTGISESFTSTNTGLPTTVQRTFDPYGQMASESVNGGAFAYSSSQSWNAAGRRTQLSIGGGIYGFGWRADGALTSASDPAGSGSYGYDTAGLLTSRTVGSRSTSIASRDGMGRPFTIVTAVNGSSKLTETMSWYLDGLLAGHTLDRSDFTDSRSYSYASLSRRLVQEQLNLNAGTTWTNNLIYDSGTSAGPGVLTQVGQGSAMWTGVADPFSRVSMATNNTVSYAAYGHVNGQATLTALLDNQPISVTGVGTNAMQWRAMMELSSGVHQLKIAAAHPSSQFKAWATNTFTNSIAYQTTGENFDGAGNITQRIWRNANGTTNRTQTLSWDARGRLHSVTERDADNSGYNWTAIYDGANRRLSTTSILVTNGVAFTSLPTTINSYFDPLVEFLELGVAYGTKNEWKLYGPDLNGVYGGMNGTGGFEGVSPGLNLFYPTISDFRGNILGVVTNGAVSWNPARPTGYGAVPGYRPVALGSGANISLSSAWRGRWVDITGYHQIGLRPYDSVSGRWLSSDSAWNERDPNYYSFAGGDPINGFDADGRCVNKTIDAAGYFAEQFSDTSVRQATAVAGWASDVAINTVAGTVALSSQGASLAAQAMGGDSSYFDQQAQQWQGYMSPYANAGYYDANNPGVQIATAATIFINPESAAGKFGSLEVGSGNAYSVAYQMKMEIPAAPAGTRYAHYQSANEAMFASMDADPMFASAMEKMIPDINAIRGTASAPENWVWNHFASEPGVMQLVPSAQHWSPNPLWSLFHPVIDGKNVGGFKIWGQQY